MSKSVKTFFLQSLWYGGGDKRNGNFTYFFFFFFFIKFASWFYLKSLRSQYQNEWINESKLKLCIAVLLIYLPFLFSGAFMLLIFYDVCVIFFGFIHIFRSSFTSAMGSSRYHFLLYISIPDSQKITVRSGSTWYASDPSQFLYCVNLLSSKT